MLNFIGSQIFEGTDCENEERKQSRLNFIILTLKELSFERQN